MITHIRVIRLFFYSLAATAILIVTASSHADVMAELENGSNNQYRSPMDVLSFRFMSDISQTELATLVLEVDAINVTSMATISNSGIQYQPIQPLIFGEHEVRLVSYASDGSIKELGYWKIDVRQSSAFRQISFNTQTDINLSQIVKEKNIDTDDKFTAQGTFVAQSQLVNDSVQIDTYMDMFAVDDPLRSSTEKRVDLNNYYVIAQANSYQFGLGTQAYANTSLLQDGLQKRGVNAAKSFNALNSRASVFSYASQNRVGFEEFTGVGEEDNRISGTTLSAIPLQSENTQIVTSMSYYYGRNGSSSYSDIYSTEQQVNEGDGSNFVIDSSFFTKQLRVRLEGAQTQYDFDGRAFGFDAIKDNAYSALIMLNPSPNPNNTSPWLWSLGAEYISVGTFFRSIANPTLPGDLSMQRIFGQLSKSQFVLDASYAKEENNLDDNINLPTIESNEWRLSSYYTFSTPTAENQTWRTWLGTPMLSLTFNGAEANDDASSLVIRSNNWQLDGMTARADFRYTRWAWSLTHSVNEFEDFTDTQIDSETQNTQWDMQLNVSQRFNLTTGWQWQQILNKDYRTVSDTKVYSLGGNGVIIKGKLNAMLTYNRNITDAQNDPFFAQDAQQDYWSASINWTAREAKNYRPGIEVSLSVTTQDYTDNLITTNSRDTMQAFLNVRTVLPTTYPGGNR